jgi:hypothetical protein
VIANNPSHTIYDSAKHTPEVAARTTLPVSRAPRARKKEVATSRTASPYEEDRVQMEDALVTEPVREREGHQEESRPYGDAAATPSAGGVTR